MGRGQVSLLDDIKRHLPKGECLVEPFVGAGSVFLNTDFSRYILADINSDLSSTLEQQAHLAEIAEGLVERHIPVLISNHDTMLTREWYQRAKLHVVKVRRSISSNGGTRKKVDELLALYKPGVVSPAKK